MATFAANDAAIQWIGRYIDSGGQRNMSGGGTQMRFRMFGKSVTITAHVQTIGTNTMKYAFDGGAFTDYNFVATGVQDTADLLAAGVDGWHDVIIICKTALTYRPVIAGAVNITADGTPLIAAHSEVWTVSKLGDTAEFTNLVSNATLGTNKRWHTWGTPSTTFGHSSPSGNLSTFCDESVAFRASCTKIAVWHAGPGPYLVYRDGVAIGSPVSGTAIGEPYALIVLAAAEDGAEHEYRVIHLSAGDNRLDAICLIGTFSATAAALGRRIAFLGDSTTKNTNGTLNSAQGFVCKLIGEYGLIGFNRGIHGDTTALMSARLSADVLSIASLHTVVVTSGANDSAVVDATLQSQCEGIYNNILADDPATICSVCEAWPSTAGNREGAVNLAAVTAVANPRCTYTDTDGWIVPATDTHDGQHLNDSGGTKIKDELYSFLFPIITVTSPAVSVIAVVGSNVTIDATELNISGDVDILLSLDGGSTFPITLASGSPLPFVWIPEASQVSSDAVIRVVDSSEQYSFGDSGVFSVEAQSIPVDVPGAVYRFAALRNTLRLRSQNCDDPRLTEAQRLECRRRQQRISRNG